MQVFVMLGRLLEALIGKFHESQPDARGGGQEPSDSDLIAIQGQTKLHRFIQLLQQNDGRMKQSDFARETEWSEATVSRVLSEMADQGVVRKIPLGRENLITLVGAEPDWYNPPPVTGDSSGSSDSDTGPREDKTILLVEDNQAEWRLFKEALQEADVDAPVHVVEDGLDAVEFICQQGQYRDAPRPALVILDLTLRVIDGLNVLQELEDRETSYDVPVLILSNSEADDDIRQAYEHGATAYIVKPDSMDDRIELVSTIDEFWFTYAIPPASVTPQQERTPDGRTDRSGD